MSALNRFNSLAFNGLFRRNSVFLAGIFASAFVVEIAFDGVSDRIWRNINKGRTWDDIKDRYTA
ncbi:ubiquinol-cytochrome c reductase subunit 9 [Thamnocephalis sphaerospora]|uniref:Complex III subunit 9 n=1 Tax=Thamnocephalis sphaerospora TaxID=78915 RepID=A0A4P9XXU2_9FUNG|nr:ubiquinol-cytochrome c reductase subunit 9 [Thamnocephalis sphaerospora]|eukprot:RKP10501.1 ubiquinol-cytochrome c reductase subunit 9 [Thamnocephalis sphaerospora]